MKKIVLASASPRRKDLLNQIGLKFDIIVSDIEEKVDANLSPESVVESLAYQKAQAISKDIKEDCLVIGSDTVVVIDEIILGKPKDSQDAFNMLKMLSGKTHKVITGVCMIDVISNKYLLQHDISHIKFRDISDNEIDAYIKTQEPFGKAGSYAVQGMSAIFVEKIEGSYTNIVGLPLYIIDNMLKQFDINVLGGNNH